MYNVTFVGNAPMDILMPVSYDILDKYELKLGDWQQVSPQVISEIVTQIADEDKTPMAGGSAGNSAFALANLGAKVAFCGYVGDDTPGKAYHESMTGAGIVMPEPMAGGKTLVIYVLITPDGERTFITTGERTPMQRTPIGKENIKEDMISKSEWVFIEGYLFDNEFDTILEVCRLARKHNTKIALTLAAPFFVEQHFSKIALLVRDGIDLYICNDEELISLKRCELSGEDTIHAEETLVALRQTPHLVTMGKNGATLHTPQGNIHVPTTAVDHVVDATGAGDAFAAGFMYGHIKNFEPTDSIFLGHQLAQRVIQHTGGRLQNGYDDIIKGINAA